MKKFNLKNNKNNRGSRDFAILDIWCQKDKVVAYVEGTYIYKTEMIIKDNQIKNYYCSCPSSDGGMSFCKHLSWVESYLSRNNILELECVEIKDKLCFKMSSEEVINKFKDEVYNLQDENYNINCYNSSYLVDIVLKYGKYINKLIEKEKYNKAFKITLGIYKVISNIFVHCYDDHDECKEDILCHLEELIDDYGYLEKTILYIENNYSDKNCKLDDYDFDILKIIASKINDKDIGKRVIKFIKNVNYDNYNEYRIKEIINEIKERCK